MVNVIPTIIFDVLLVGAAVALFGATVRSMLPRGGGTLGRFLPSARRRSPRSVRGELSPGLGRVVPLTTRRQALARRAS